MPKRSQTMNSFQHTKAISDKRTLSSDFKTRHIGTESGESENRPVLIAMETSQYTFV